MCSIGVDIAQGGSDQTIDFGFYLPVTIGNYVWNDLNGNGVQDDGATGIAGVTVALGGCALLVWRAFMDGRER